MGLYYYIRKTLTMKRILILLCTATSLSAFMPPPKKPRVQEITYNSLPPDLKREILRIKQEDICNGIQAGAVLNIPSIAREVLTLSHINKEFRAHVNDPSFILPLLRSLPKAGALVLANTLEKMSCVQSPVVQDWLLSITDAQWLISGQPLNEMVLHENLVPLCIAIIRTNPNYNINWRDGVGTTALMKASICGRTEIVRHLLPAGADVNAKRIGNLSALMVASSAGHTEIVRLLIAAGARVDAQDEWGGTALTWAVENGHTNVAKLLVDAHANANITNKKGHTARYYAQKYGHGEIIKLLDDVGARGSYYWHWCPIL